MKQAVKINYLTPKKSAQGIDNTLDGAVVNETLHSDTLQELKNNLTKKIEKELS